MSLMSCPIMYGSRQGFVTNRSVQRKVRISNGKRRTVKSQPIALIKKKALVGSRQLDKRRSTGKKELGKSKVTVEASDLRWEPKEGGDF